MSMLIPTIIAIWISWIIPVIPSDLLLKHSQSSKISVQTIQMLPEYVSRFALVSSTVGFILPLLKLPVSILALGPRMASQQTGIIVKMEGAKFELTGLDKAIDNARIIQLIWAAILWSLLLGPKLSAASSLEYNFVYRHIICDIWLNQFEFLF